MANVRAESGRPTGERRRARASARAESRSRAARLIVALGLLIAVVLITSVVAGAMRMSRIEDTARATLDEHGLSDVGVVVDGSRITVTEAESAEHAAEAGRLLSDIPGVTEVVVTASLPQTGPTGPGGTSIPDTPPAVAEQIIFPPDGTDITTDQTATIDRVEAHLRANEGSIVRLIGHTAPMGGTAEDASLAFERAQSVADELAARGIDPSRIVVASRGPLQPIVQDEADPAYANNRRVDVAYLDLE